MSNKLIRHDVILIFNSINNAMPHVDVVRKNKLFQDHLACMHIDVLCIFTLLEIFNFFNQS